MQRVREFLRDILRQTDLVLLALCCTATAYGILMIYSATRYMETLRLVLVQTGGAVVGIILFFLLSLVDISELMRKKGWLWLTLFGLGMTIGLVSVVNTFLHIRTPFLISLLRTGWGVLFGLLIGLALVLLAELIYRAVRHFCGVEKHV